jgi:hypothetical protein
LYNKQSSNINQILGEAIAFKQNLILIQKIAVTATNISNNLGVDSKRKGGTETTNSLVTLKAILDVDNSQVNAEKARQAAAAAAAAAGQDSTETKNYYNSDKSDINSDRDAVKDKAGNNKIL